MKIHLAPFLFAIIIIGSDGERVSRQVQSSSNCLTNPAKEQGDCIFLEQCPGLSTFLASFNDSTVATDYLTKSLCGYENGMPKVCCLRDQTVTIIELTSTFTNETRKIISQVPNAGNNVTTSNNVVDDDRYYKLLSPPQCGITNVPQKGITDGRVEIGAWPWIAALAYTKDVDDNNVTYWLCVGALITSRHVLSAAHCTDNQYLEVYKVRLGQVDTSPNITGDDQPLDVYVERIIPHPSFKRGNLSNDIAVIRLVEEVEFSKNIQPICLPIASNMRKMSFAGYFAVVAGWGASNQKWRGVPVDPFLRQLQFPVVDNDECQVSFKGKLEIYSNQLCAGFRRGGKAACQGDSGAPLMWKKRLNYYALGILSFGWSCTDTGFINGFARITSFIPWIEQIIKSPKLNSTSGRFGQTAGTSSVSTPITGPSTASKVTNAITFNSGVQNVYELASPPNCGNITVPKRANVVGIWPWVAALGYRQNNTSPTQWLCAGHLITSRHVITVGHCAKHSSLTLYMVRLGINDLQDKIPVGANAIDLDIERIIMHPSYTGRMHTGDIAILKLEDDVPFNDNVQPICIPKSVDLQKMAFIDSQLAVTGWGEVWRNGTSIHQSLQNIQVPIVGNEECNKTYARKRINIDKTQLCAGLPRGSCLVDSGGPLMWSEAGTYYLFGLVSYALGCAQPGYPDIFTRITSYIDWIEDNIKY